MGRKSFALLLVSIFSMLTVAMSVSAEEPSFGDPDDNVPPVVATPGLDPIMEHREPIEIQATDNSSPYVQLSAIELREAESGREIEGVKTDWDTKCPDGFIRVDEETCRWTQAIEPVPQCPNGFDLVDEGGGDYSCEREETTSPSPSCPSGYSLSASGDRCFQVETKPADPICDSGWTRNGDECERQVSVSANSVCPDGYSLSSGQCKKTESREALMGCPDGGDLIDGQCVIEKTVPADGYCSDGGERAAGGFFDSGDICNYSNGEKYAGEPTVKYRHTCDTPGYARNTVDGKPVCARQAECPSGHNMAMVGTSVATGDPIRGCRSDTKRSGSHVEIEQWFGSAYILPNSAYCTNSQDSKKAVTSGSFGLSSTTVLCYHDAEKESYLACDLGSAYSFGVPTYYSDPVNGSCYYQSTSLDYRCENGGDLQSSSDGWVCHVDGKEAPQAECPQGYTLDDSSAVCGKVKTKKADKECPTSMVLGEDGQECISDVTAVSSTSCGSGETVYDGQCVETNVTQAPECPTGTIDDGAYCVEKETYEPETSYSCPVASTGKESFPDTCKPHATYGGVFQLWTGLPEDVGKSNTYLRQRCMAVKEGLGSMEDPQPEFKPLSEESRCIYSQGQIWKDGAWPTQPKNGGMNVHSDIETSKFCPGDGELDGNVCVREIRTPKCSGGAVYEDGKCIEETTTVASFECPAGFVEENGGCVADRSQPPEYVCDDGWNLDGKTCWKMETEPYTGSSCSSGFSLVGGECTRSDTTSASSSCPSGMTEQGGTCVETDVKAADLTCESGWTLQGSKCVKESTTTPSPSCGGDEWTLNGGNCERLVEKPVSMVCPEGFQTENSVCTDSINMNPIQGNRITVDIPPLLPGEHEITGEVKDFAGNVAEFERTFTYDPQDFAIQTEDGDNTITMPAVGARMARSDGSEAFVSEKIVDADGDRISGPKTVFFGLRPDSDGLVTNNQLFRAGDISKVFDNYDFSDESATLEMPIHPSVENRAGSSKAAVVVEGENESWATEFDVESWLFDAAVVVDPENPKQILDDVQVEALVENGVCQPEAALTDAQRAGVFGEDPACLIEWNTIPMGIVPDVQGAPTADGSIDEAGEQTVGFDAYVVDGSGEKFLIGSGEKTVDVEDLRGSLELEFRNEFDTVLQTVQEFNQRLTIADGFSCRLTTDEQAAINIATGNTPLQACYIEWASLPPGVSQRPDMSDPMLDGTTDVLGEHTIGWNIYTYTSTGMPVLVNQQEKTIEVIEPPAPEITFEGKNPVEGVEDLYAVGIDRQVIGDMRIRSRSAALEVDVISNGSTIKSDLFRADPFNKWLTTARRLKVNEPTLWDTENRTVQVRYQKLPEVGATKTVEGLVVPSQMVTPVVEADIQRRKVVDTQTLDVKVHMRNAMRRSDPYIEEKDGVWEVRVGVLGEEREFDAISGWKSVDGSSEEAIFSVDPQTFGAQESSVQLYAQAELVSQHPDYERTELSRQPLFFEVVKGAAIEASISDNLISGEAPLFASFFLDEKTGRDRAALGKVEWQVSKDGGDSWEVQDTGSSSRRVARRMSRKFEEGVYQVRARMVNAFTDAESYTDPVEVNAYFKPEIEVTGPETLFVTDEAKYELSVARKDGSELALSDVSVQWSEDKGKTWHSDDMDRVIGRDEPERVRLFVRAKSDQAPENDERAWTEVREIVRFREIREPRVGISGGRVLEVGKERPFEAVTRLPYRDTPYEIEGEFVLPNGDVVEGKEMTYTPTEQDLAKERIEFRYRAWVKGWKDQGAVDVDAHRARVWIYKWPNFSLRERLSAEVAPAEGVLFVRALNFSGRLDEPSYEWDVPSDGVSVEASGNPRAREITFEEPGEYPVTITVTDARGNEEVIEKVFDIGSADPLSVDTTVVPGNEFMRAPLEVLVRAGSEGGHPRDRVDEFSYFVNGSQLEGSGRFARAELEEGTHEISVKAVTRMGETAEATRSVTVNPNQSPDCSISTREGRRSWRLSADCEDPDGRIDTHQWSIDGERSQVRSSRITVGFSQGEQVTVRLEAVDDSGAKSAPKQVVLDRPESSEPEPEQGQEEGDDGGQGGGGGTPSGDEPQDSPGTGPESVTGEVVPDNEAPSCTLSREDQGGEYRFVANCEDADGSVRDIMWWVAERRIAMSSDSITIRKGTAPGAEVALRAKDDVGQLSPTATSSLPSQ